MRYDVLKQLSNMKEEELVNKSEIARRFGCDRRTIDNYLEKLKSNTSSDTNKLSKESILDNYKSTIIDKVDTYSSSSMAVYKFIQKKGYVGGYQTVNNFVKKHKKVETKKATIRFETSPGLQAQVDWKENITMVNKNGEKFFINFFLIVLGYSRLKFTKLTVNRNQKTLFECMVESFKYYQGIPREILFDNMKTVVDRAKSTFNNVVINEKFKCFAQDSGFEILTCRAYRPKTKGKVETLARLAERLRPYNEEFETFEDLEKIVDEFNTDVNNEVSQGTNKVPFVRFESEKEYLNPLPSMDLLMSYFHKEKEYKVYPDSMINFKGQKYSVPTRFIGNYVTVHESDNTISIYYTEDLIVSHTKTTDFLNYKKEHAFEILKSDAFKDWDDSSIEDFIENNLSKMDEMLN